LHANVIFLFKKYPKCLREEEEARRRAKRV